MCIKLADIKVDRSKRENCEMRVNLLISTVVPLWKWVGARSEGGGFGDGDLGLFNGEMWQRRYQRYKEKKAFCVVHLVALPLQFQCDMTMSM